MTKTSRGVCCILKGVVSNVHYFSFVFYPSLHEKAGVFTRLRFNEVISFVDHEPPTISL